MSCAHQRFGTCQNCQREKHDQRNSDFRAELKRNKKADILTKSEMEHLDPSRIIRSRRLSDGTFEVEVRK